MKYFFTILFSCILATLFAQTEQDTTIYNVAEKQPSFPGCDYNWYSDAQKDSCRMTNLMRFLSANLRYPEEARDKNIAGRVVVRFVVEKNGTVSNAKILKDIGGGCGNEALRIINGMNPAGVKWNVGLIKNLPVRVAMTLPIQFKLEEDPGYKIVDGYPVFYLVDKPLRLKDTTQLLNEILQKNLKLPKIINDSCKVGVIQSEVLVLPDGSAKVLTMDDFCNLGYDAQFEAIHAVNATNGIWSVAEYKGKKVPVSVNTRIVFRPDAPKCKAVVANFEKAYTLMQESVDFSEKKEDEKSLNALNEALKIQPENMEFLYLRGILFMNLNRQKEACEDLTKVKQTLNVNWVDSLLPLICR